jgi:uncharacterized membrane protein YtjA (UPF0391 family)
MPWRGTSVARSSKDHTGARWRGPSKGMNEMLYWAAVFLVIALIAGFLGFFGIASGAAGIAKILFFAFLVIAALSFLFGLRRTPT